MLNLWLVCVDKIRMRSLKLGYELGNIVYLKVVKNTWIDLLAWR